MSEYRLQVRIPDALYAELRDAARRDGVTVSEFVRRSVADRIERRTVKQLAEQIAVYVGRDLVAQMEQLAAQLREDPDAPAQEAPFDRGCLDADLHRPGARCAGCGGSFYT